MVCVDTITRERRLQGIHTHNITTLANKVTIHKENGIIFMLHLTSPFCVQSFKSFSCGAHQLCARRHILLTVSALILTLVVYGRSRLRSLILTPLQP